MKTDNLILLADVTNDATQWSPLDMLRTAAKDMQKQYPHVKKALVIFYDEDNSSNRKRIRWQQSGMRRSEILNLLSLAHDDIILAMIDDVSD